MKKPKEYLILERRRQEEAREEADAMVSYNKQFDLRVRTDTYIHGHIYSWACSLAVVLVAVHGVCARITFILNFKYPSHLSYYCCLAVCT